MGIEGLDVHNEQHCRRVLRIGGLDVDDDSIATGRWE